MKNILLAILLLIFSGCSIISPSTKNDGIVMCIELYEQIDKRNLPKTLNIEDKTALISFASKELHLQKNNLKVVYDDNYIIIHYENEKYIKAHPDWKMKKYGEAMVIQTDKRNYVAFRLSQT